MTRDQLIAELNKYDNLDVVLKIDSTEEELSVPYEAGGKIVLEAAV